MNGLRHLTLAAAFAATLLGGGAPAEAQVWYPYYGPGPYYAPYPPGYPYGYGYPYSRYPYAPPATAPASASPAPQFWYRCDEPKGYYPHVPSCPGGWHEEQAPTATTVTPTTPPRGR